jgi:hypothetical protein
MSHELGAIEKLCYVWQNRETCKKEEVVQNHAF